MEPTEIHHVAFAISLRLLNRLEVSVERWMKKSIAPFFNIGCTIIRAYRRFKGMKVRYLKLKNWLLVTLMGALGLSGCHCHKKLAEPEPDSNPPAVRDRGEMLLMYGVPTMNYQIRGQVKNAKGRPVKDIRVNMLERNMETTAEGALVGDPEAIDRWLQNTEVKTDKKGRFEIKNSGLPQEQVRLMVRDVDGKSNGDYKNRVVEMDVTPDDVDRTNAGGWNQGTYNKEVKINLENK